MQFCPACGGRVGPDFNACPSCGKNLEQARAISRLNQGRGTPKAEPLAARTSKVAERTVAHKASTAYGMAAKSSIWGAEKKSGSAAPPTAKKRSAGASSRTQPRGSKNVVAEVEAEAEAPAPEAATSAADSGYACYRCGSALRYIPEYQRWYCDSCYSYV